MCRPMLALALGTFAQGQSLPKSVTIGTNPAGTVYFALASGIAKVVSGGAGYQMVVQPHAGTSTMLPLINSDEMECGIQNDVNLVPVNSVNDGVDELLQGRADVTQHALNSANVKEADAAVGVRHISDD